MHNPKLRWIFFLLLVCLVVVFAWFSDAPSGGKTVIDRAVKVAEVGEWSPVQDVYFWIAADEILLLKSDVVSPRDRRFVPLQITRCNVATQAVTELTALEKVLTKDTPNFVENWQLSPDGRWILSQQWVGGRTGRMMWAATTLDGKRQIMRPQKIQADERVQAVWMPDSRRWVQLGDGRYKAHVLTYNVDAPGVTDSVQDFQPSSRRVLGFVNPARCLAYYGAANADGGIGFANFGAGPTASARSLYQLWSPLKGFARIPEVRLSPSGDRLAWIMLYNSPPLGMKILTQTSFYAQRALTQIHLCVSHVDGTDWKEIGTAPVGNEWSGVTWAAVKSLRWTPDGKRLSFVYKNALYTVPAD